METSSGVDLPFRRQASAFSASWRRFLRRSHLIHDQVNGRLLRPVRHHIPRRFGHEPYAAEQYDWNYDLDNHDWLVLPMSGQVLCGAIDTAG